MIKLGDRITVKPATFDVPGKDGKPKAIPGTVVYVHPGGRYCVLEFDVGRREITDVAHSYAREVEHSDLNLQRLSIMFRHQKCFHIGRLCGALLEW